VGGGDGGGSNKEIVRHMLISWDQLCDCSQSIFFSCGGAEPMPDGDGADEGRRRCSTAQKWPRILYLAGCGLLRPRASKLLSRSFGVANADPVIYIHAPRGQLASCRTATADRSREIRESQDAVFKVQLMADGCYGLPAGSMLLLPSSSEASSEAGCKYNKHV